MCYLVEDPEYRGRVLVGTKKIESLSMCYWETNLHLGIPLPPGRGTSEFLDLADEA